jgi:GTPase
MKYFFIDNNADSITLNILEQLVGTVFLSRNKVLLMHDKRIDCAKGNIISIDLDTIYDPSYIDGMVLSYEDKDLVLCYSIKKLQE